MVTSEKEMRRILPISIVINETYLRSRRIVTIGNIPR